jgi:hypothetical protein
MLTATLDIYWRRDGQQYPGDKMSVYNWKKTATTIVMSLGLPLGWAAPTHAVPAAGPLNGRYSVTLFTDQKTGTSIAASQNEDASTNVEDFATACSTSTCVATVVDGPAATNPTIPQPARYAWDGTKWAEVVNFQWECLRPDGAMEWNPARSEGVYRPQPDGSLIGQSHTDILSGTCQGTVDFPVKAVPVQGN